jgi:hypothetical protein
MRRSIPRRLCSRDVSMVELRAALDALPNGYKFVGTNRIGDTRYYRFQRGRDALEMPLRCYR